jgi:phosphoglycolate phosphatase-like HAD superfamily hydrolase
VVGPRGVLGPQEEHVQRDPEVAVLAVFDVDGTITETTAIDAEIYARVFCDVFGAPLPTTDWAEYEHATDQGVAQEAVERAGLDPRRIAHLKQRFVAALREALERHGAREVPGAAALLDRLAELGHAVAFATGAWEESARAKLASAGIAVGGRVLVGSDVQVVRAEIIREAIRQAPRARRTVYVGDGSWDVKAARALGIPFVGVDRRGTGRLALAGAREVVADFRDVGGALAALARAAVPDGGSC